MPSIGSAKAALHVQEAAFSLEMQNKFCALTAV